MAGLTQEQIRQILAKRRKRGIYEQYFLDFLKSDEGGINVREQWPDLNERKAASLKQGFDGLKDKATFKEQLEEAGFTLEDAEMVNVIANDEQVYLINLRKVEASPVAETA
jgi:hypothetical protein